MMRRVALALGLLIAPSLLIAYDGQKVIDGFLQPAGYVQLASLGTSTSLTGIPTGVLITLIQAEGDDLRWRDDGTDPTAAIGMLLADGQTLVYNGNPSEIEIIETTGSGIANVSFYR